MCFGLLREWSTEDFSKLNTLELFWWNSLALNLKGIKKKLKHHTFWDYVIDFSSHVCLQLNTNMFYLLFIFHIFVIKKILIPFILLLAPKFLLLLGRCWPVLWLEPWVGIESIGLSGLVSSLTEQRYRSWIFLEEM